MCIGYRWQNLVWLFCGTHHIHMEWIKCATTAQLKKHHRIKYRFFLLKFSKKKKKSPAMEGCSLQSPTVTSVPSCLFLRGLAEKPFVHGQVLKFRNSKGYTNAGKLKFLNIRTQASGIWLILLHFIELVKWGCFGWSYNLTTLFWVLFFILFSFDFVSLSVTDTIE